jgi:hypothetical protein
MSDQPCGNLPARQAAQSICDLMGHNLNADGAFQKTLRSSKGFSAKFFLQQPVKEKWPGEKLTQLLTA